MDVRFPVDLDQKVEDIADNRKMRKSQTLKKMLEDMLPKIQREGLHLKPKKEKPEEPQDGKIIPFEK